MEKTNIFKCKPTEVHFTIRDRNTEFAAYCPLAELAI